MGMKRLHIYVFRDLKTDKGESMGPLMEIRIESEQNRSETKR